MLPGPDGELWVSAYSLPGDEERQWYVFGEDGFLRALLRVPAAFRLVDARRDIVAGVWTDELGVQMVKVYALARD